MEQTGILNQGGGKIEYIDPSKITAGQKYKTGLVFIYPATPNAIDDVDALFTGWIVFNENVKRWQEAGQDTAKGNWDASGGTLPSTNIIAGDKYIISVSGAVNGIQLNENDTITAKIDNATDSQTGGIFDDWTVVRAITVTSTNVSRPNGDSVEDGLVDLQNEKVDIIVGKQLSTEDYTTVEKNKLAGVEENAEVNVQANWNETNITNDAFINNKPTLGTASSKNVGTAVGEIQENGDILGSSETVETNADGKIITASKNTAYNKNFGTGNSDVARGDASYLKNEINNALATNSTNDRARTNHTGEQSITTITGLQTALDTKEDNSNKGIANGYASLNGSGQVPASQLPSYVDDVVEYANFASFPTTGEGGKVYIALDNNLTYRWSGSAYVKLNDIDLSDYFNKTTHTLDDVSAGTTNKHFTSTLENKLNDIENNATADQTAEEIKTAYEDNADTNAFTDAEQTKLLGIEAGAKVNVQADLSQTDNNQDDYVIGKSTSNIEDSTDKRYITDAQQTLLNNTFGTNTGDETVISIQTKRPLKMVEGQSLEGSGNVDLPVSTAQQTALDGKINIADNLSDVADRQEALNNLTDVDNATDEYVLTKDTETGDAKWKSRSAPDWEELDPNSINFIKNKPTDFITLSSYDATSLQALAYQGSDDICYTYQSKRSMTIDFGSLIETGTAFVISQDDATDGVTPHGTIIQFTKNVSVSFELEIAWSEREDTVQYLYIDIYENGSWQSTSTNSSNRSYIDLLTGERRDDGTGWVALNAVTLQQAESFTTSFNATFYQNTKIRVRLGWITSNYTSTFSKRSLNINEV